MKRPPVIHILHLFNQIAVYTYAQLYTFTFFLLAPWEKQEGGEGGEWFELVIPHRAL
jgi:hypothetical protein